jgi:hypothetical protein
MAALHRCLGSDDPPRRRATVPHQVRHHATDAGQNRRRRPTGAHQHLHPYAAGLLRHRRHATDGPRSHRTGAHQHRRLRPAGPHQSRHHAMDADQNHHQGPRGAHQHRGHATDDHPSCWTDDHRHPSHAADVPRPSADHPYRRRDSTARSKERSRNDQSRSSGRRSAAGDRFARPKLPRDFRHADPDRNRRIGAATPRHGSNRAVHPSVVVRIGRRRRRLRRHLDRLVPCCVILPYRDHRWVVC